MAQRTCSVDGCTAPHRAKDFCATHYNQNRYTPDQRHAKVTVPCDWCGKPCTKEQGRAKRYGGLFCTYPCRDAWRIKHGHVLTDEARAKGNAVIASRQGRARAKLRKAARGTRGGRWVCGRCSRCGAAFVAQYNPLSLAMYCSRSCKKMDHTQRRDRAKRAGRSERYSRMAIFERDRWRCHICRKMTDRTRTVPHPKAPTIDHLVPLSEGGDDTAANVATACLLCNSTRGDRGGGEQLRLIG